MIKPLTWTADQSKVTLGALRAIATSCGTVDMSSAEKELIDGVRINIFDHPEITDAEENVHVQGDDLAAVLQDPEHKSRAAQLIALMPYAARPYDNDKLHTSERFIEAIGETMFEMEDFLGARAKHSKTMEYCMLRKMGPQIFTNTDPDFVHAEMVKLLNDAEGNAEELERYKSLAGYPAGSLGKAYFDFYAKFGWPLPGDPKWISEDITVRHDLIHVLCDYDITIDGEFCVSGFTAGNSEKFDWMIAMLGFTPPYVSTGEQYSPGDFTKAYARGKTATHSFVDEWDFWPRMMHPMEDLRTEYGI